MMSETDPARLFTRPEGAWASLQMAEEVIQNLRKEKCTTDKWSMMTSTLPPSSSSPHHPKIPKPAPHSSEDSRRKATRTNGRSQLSMIDLIELFSVPRLAEQPASSGVSIHREVFDLRAGWDCRLKKHRERAWSVVESESPWIIVMSLPCSQFSTLMRTNWSRMSAESLRIREEEALGYWAFCLEVVLYQHQRGRKFLIEHPAHAMSWQLEGTKYLQGLPGMRRVEIDMCHFGLDAGPGEYHRKPTALLTTDESMYQQFLGRRCDGCHDHIRLEGLRARKAQGYTPDFCGAILKSLKDCQCYRDEPL